jgi:hypothetical protein
MDLGFAVLGPLPRHRRPPIRFLFIGSRLCSTLLSGPASRRVLFSPLRFANPSSPSDWVEDLHLQAVVHARHTKKENRAGWPGFFCVELDAVTSQRGATSAEAAVLLLRRVHRSKHLPGKRKPTCGWMQAACHASVSFACIAQASGFIVVRSHGRQPSGLARHFYFRVRSKIFAQNAHKGVH